MKKLTSLDLQTAMDECAEIKFNSHGEWLAGMVKRLNAKLINLQKNKDPVIVPAIKTIIITGNTSEPIIPCKT